MFGIWDDFKNSQVNYVSMTHSRVNNFEIYLKRDHSSLSN